jgi:hypothetical protein
MTELSLTAKVLIASAKANCVREWDNVNDPPCHPGDDKWCGCDLCIKRVGIAAALRVIGNHLVTEGNIGAGSLILSVANEIVNGNFSPQNIND